MHTNKLANILLESISNGIRTAFEIDDEADFNDSIFHSNLKDSKNFDAELRDSGLAFLNIDRDTFMRELEKRVSIPKSILKQFKWMPATKFKELPHMHASLGPAAKNTSTTAFIGDNWLSFNGGWQDIFDIADNVETNNKDLSELVEILKLILKSTNSYDSDTKFGKMKLSRDYAFVYFEYYTGRSIVSDVIYMTPHIFTQEFKEISKEECKLLKKSEREFTNYIQDSGINVKTGYWKYTNFFGKPALKGLNIVSNNVYNEIMKASAESLYTTISYYFDHSGSYKKIASNLENNITIKYLPLATKLIDGWKGEYLYEQYLIDDNTPEIIVAPDDHSYVIFMYVYSNGHYFVDNCRNIDIYIVDNRDKSIFKDGAFERATRIFPCKTKLV